jgi:hypothetical protein
VGVLTFKVLDVQIHSDCIIGTGFFIINYEIICAGLIKCRMKGLLLVFFSIMYSKTL